MPRFFMAGTNIKGGMAIMTGRDAEHVHVLRLRPGEDMIICDGQGTDYKCRLVKADKEQVEAEVVEVVRCPAEPTVKVTVLCGLPKGDKTDYIIQKSVEAGAYEILFFQSSRCVAKPDKAGAVAAHRRRSGQAVRPGHHPPGGLGRGLYCRAGHCGKEGPGPVYVRDRGAGGAGRGAERQPGYEDRRHHHRAGGGLPTL